MLLLLPDRISFLLLSSRGGGDLHNCQTEFGNFFKSNEKESLSSNQFGRYFKPDLKKRQEYCSLLQLGITIMKIESFFAEFLLKI